MKKTMRYIGMAALALVGAIFMGCSENDLAENSPKGKAVTLTTTISLDGSSVATRALDADGKKTFAKGEQIALVYQDANDGVQKAVSAELQETDITNEGKSATLTFSLEKAPKASGQLRCIYPAAMLSGDFNPELKPNIDNENTINFPSLLNNQDGTLATIASKYDLAVYDGTFTSEAELPGSISLKNQLAIIAFTIKDHDGNDITGSTTNLEIDQGLGKFGYTVTRTAAAGPIYVAMMPTENAKENITISALASTTLYEKEVKDVTLKASTLTPVTAKMQKVVDLSTLTSDYEAQDSEILKGTLSTNVKISIAAGATVTLKDANINMDDDGHAKWTSGDYAGITCLGDATIILSGTNKVHAFATYYPGIQAAYNGSNAEYTLTIQGDGSLEAIGGQYGAGIGSGNGGYCGNIKIEGGNITAKGGDGAAGIGSGNDAECGDITISGNASINATGGSGGAGIGGGSDSPCNDITISGGTITATGGQGAAGIGSSYKINCGNITITSDVTKVTATKGYDFNGTNCIGTDNDAKCGIIKFGTATVYTGDSSSSNGNWVPGPMVAGEYGGLTLTISTTTEANDTWTLTPTSN